MIYSEKNGIPYLESRLRKGAIVIADQYNIPLGKSGKDYESYLKMVLSTDFIRQILKSEKTVKTRDIRAWLRKNTNLETEKDIEECTQGLIKDLFKESDVSRKLLQTIPESLNEMAINFFRYWQRTNNLKTVATNTVPYTYGGIVKTRKDEMTLRGGEYNPTNERLSEIYPFHVRDAMYREYNPIRIITYDGFNKDDIIPGEFTLYIFENSNEQDGYLGISEPFEGDKSTRAFFISREEIQSKQKDGEDENGFWKNLGKKYISMSKGEFGKKDGTSILRHTGTMESFRKKIGGILGEEKTTSKDPQHANIRRIREKLGLVGIRECQAIVAGVTTERYSNAKNAIGTVIEAGKPEKEAKEQHVQ